MDLDLLTLTAIIIGSIVPPVIFITWMYRADRYRPKRFVEVLKALVAGFTLSSVGGIILSLALLVPIIIIWAIYNNIYVLDVPLDTGAIALVTAVIVAPIAEELVKAGTVMIFRRQLTNLESGIIFGAAVGLGFAAMENILYGYDALGDGLEFALMVIGLRSITAAIGHASYTAISGYGIARWNRAGAHGFGWAPYYLMAVVLHAFSNLMASLNLLIPLGDWSQVAIIVVIFVMDVSIFLLLRRRVKQLDKGGSVYEMGATTPQTQQL